LYCRLTAFCGNIYKNIQNLKLWNLYFFPLNRIISWILHLDLPSTAAFTIHTSQNTLTISYLVWAGYFAAKFPMAFIPAIAYQLTQMVMDMFVAHLFRRKTEPARLKHE